MPHEHNPKTFNVDRLRAHEIAGQSSMYAPAITGDFVDGITGNFKELYVDGIKHVPKVQFVYGFRFGGDCTKLDYYNAHANNNFISVSILITLFSMYYRCFFINNHIYSLPSKTDYPFP